MIPVEQLCVHDPGKGVLGDCFRASIASLLELPAELVPHFCGSDERNKSGEWSRDLQEFLATLGYCFIEYQYIPTSFFELAHIETIYHTLTGPSPRFPKEKHCVVGCNGRIVHDPHPDKTGLAGYSEEWTTGFIIPLGTKGMTLSAATTGQIRTVSTNNAAGGTSSHSG